MSSNTPSKDKDERKQLNLDEWERYLLVREMQADDRTQPYIAKKLGFNNASSVQNILNRFQGLEELIERHTRDARLDELGMYNRFLSHDENEFKLPLKATLLNYTSERYKAVKAGTIDWVEFNRLSRDTEGNLK